MRQLSKKTITQAEFGGITASEAEFDYTYLDWHSHEKPYFSLNLSGICSETNKHETLECRPHSLVFHNCEEAHCNAKRPGITRQFQLEIELDWLNKFDVDAGRLPKTSHLNDPGLKLAFYNLYKESKLPDDASPLTVDSLVLQVISTMSSPQTGGRYSPPLWVRKANEILNDNFDQSFTLQELSFELGLHWAHLSRDFPKYFRCNFGQYIRKIRVERSYPLLLEKKLNLTDIAMTCGFADQSHFIRCFKEFNGITPKRFRHLLHGI